MRSPGFWHSTTSTDGQRRPSARSSRFEGRTTSGGGTPPQAEAAAQAVLHQLFDPSLRMCDVPNGDKLLAALHASGGQDPYLLEVASRVARQQAQVAAAAAADPFWQNYPPRGRMIEACANGGALPLAALPTQDLFAVPLAALARSAVIVGPPGAGKTNLLRLLVLGLLRTPSTVLVFDRKGDAMAAGLMRDSRLPILHLRWEELKLAMLQRPPGMPIPAFLNVQVQLLGSQLNLWASRRLLLDTLERCFARCPAASETNPTLREWIHAIETTKATGASRLGQYREATLYALRSIDVSLGSTINYAASDMAERITTYPGCVVVDVSTLSVEMASLLTSLLISWAYETRGLREEACSRLLFVVLDDALPLAKGTLQGEAEGGLNPLSNWLTLSRSRGMGFAVSLQNYAYAAPAITSNCMLTVCCGSCGRDAVELARNLHLTPAQAARLPLLQAGEAVLCARGVWPLAVYGRIPEVP